MGVKAVWGHTDRLLCFGSRGGNITNHHAYFSQSRRTAEKAIGKPYIVTIGGGEHVPPELNGRVLDLVRATGVYGETKVFLGADTYERLHMEQWPVCVILSEVYRFDGEPHLTHDLGLPNKAILAAAYDGVVRDEDRIEMLWQALRDVPVSRQWEIQTIPGFRDPVRVQLCGSQYPRVQASSPEGARIWKAMSQLERNPALARAVKDLNGIRNGGRIICDACDFSDGSRALFDAHHLDPLGTGPRYSNVESFAVLCPTCHRWAHYKAEDRLQPLPLSAIRAARS